MPLKKINSINSLSVIGLGKNAGKTTFLNRILYEIFKYSNRNVGLTSIGRDGEDTDVVTKTSKPKIYIKSGTLIATASDLIRKCDITKEILETTAIPTSMGQVVILRALSDGYVEIAGPSSTSDLRHIESVFRKYEENSIFIVDGALSRKSTAGHSLTDGTILCTGASVNENEDRLVSMTMNTVNLLTLDEISDKYREVIEKSNARILMFDTSGEDSFEVREIETDIALKSATEIKDNLLDNTSLLFVRGAVTDSLIKGIADNVKFRQLTLCAEDGTRFLFNEKTSEELKIRNIDLKVMRRINLMAIGINPYSVNEYMMDSMSLQMKLEKKLKEVNKNTPVIDVRRFEGRIF